MQQAVLDDWFLRQDILDQLMGQEEDLSEAERYADRILRIAQEESAEHQVLSDPFDRSVALVLSLVKEEGMDPWNIDLSAFLKLFTQRVRKEASGLDLPACGRLIRMSWEVLTQQASTLFDRVIALDFEDEEDFTDFGWEAEYDDEEFIFTSSVLEGSADQVLPSFFGERIRRDEGRPSTLGELLSALKDACDEAEILKAKEEYRKEHAAELKNMLDNVGSRMHNEDMEGDIRAEGEGDVEEDDIVLAASDGFFDNFFFDVFFLGVAFLGVAFDLQNYHHIFTAWLSPPPPPFRPPQK